MKEENLKKTLFLLLGLTSAIYLAGCATYETHTTGNVIDNEMVNSIRPGVTTRTEIIDTFGVPTETTSEGGLETLIYSYNETKVPVYLGAIKDESRARETTVTTLEITLKGDIVSTYRFKSSSEE